MKANELRIGNLVLTDRNNSIKTIVEVRSFIVSVEYIRTDTNCKHQSMVDYERLIPIPITEAWLLKFGFEKDNSENNKTYLSPTVNGNRIKIYFNRFGVAKFTMNMFHQIEIEYVHQLQNLYFALTGEELTIK
jgi:hypothetical protein